MHDFEFVLTLAHGFAPAKPVIRACDVIELRRNTLDPERRDTPSDQEAMHASAKPARSSP